MKTKEEIGRLGIDYSDLINMSRGITSYSIADAVVYGYTKCQQDTDQQTKELSDYKKWFFEEQKRADDLRMELETLNIANKLLREEIESLKESNYERANTIVDFSSCLTSIQSEINNVLSK